LLAQKHSRQVKQGGGLFILKAPNGDLPKGKTSVTNKGTGITGITAGG